MKTIKLIMLVTLMALHFYSCKKENNVLVQAPAIATVVIVKTINDSLKNGLLAYFSFNGSLFDSSGNGNGIILNGASSSIDRFANQNFSYKFSANKNMYIQAPKSELNLMNNFSLCAWILPDVVTPSVSMILSKHDGQSNTGWTFGLWNPLNLNLINFQANDQFNSATYPSKYPYLKGVVPVYTWTNCVVTYDATSKFLSYYLNGILESTINLSFSPVANNNPITIGYQNSSNWSDVFIGSIDEIRIYNRVLEKNEIIYLGKH